MQDLVRENARTGREMRGVAVLTLPQSDDSAWAARRAALLRARSSDADPAARRREPRVEAAAPRGALTVSSVPSAPSVPSGALVPSVASASSVPSAPQPQWKMSKVLVGHRGWVWSAAVDPGNAWFATGGGDGVIKVWDLTTGALRLNLTGHNEAVRGVALSTLSPYMFSGGDDHSVKCWDLERNEIIRDFHGHKSAVHCVATHPTLDVVVSGGRDKTVRVWDVRSRACAQLLVGHSDSVMSLATQQADPQVLSGGSDGMIYLWEIAAGRAFTRLTRHKKPVRGLAIAPSGTLASCGADGVRVWSLPTGEYICSAETRTRKQQQKQKQQQQQCEDDAEVEAEAETYRWSCCALSPRGVLAVGSQEGRIALYDWRHEQWLPYQTTRTKSVPGTLPGEGGINCVAFDASGSRMITAESDKSVKIWKTRE